MPLLTLEQCRAQCRVDGDYADAELAALLASAEDAAAAYLNRSVFADQAALDSALDAFPAEAAAAASAYSAALAAADLEQDPAKSTAMRSVARQRKASADLAMSRTLAGIVVNPLADPGEHFPDEVWYIERKVGEDDETVEFELTTVADFNGRQLPARQCTRICSALLHGGYRGPYCGYTGSAYFDINDQPVDDPARDVCAGLVRSCQLRFGQDKAIPHGGFPAAGLLRT